MQRILRRERGLTLIETMIASGLTLLFLSVLYFFVRNLMPGARSHLESIRDGAKLDFALRRIQSDLDRSEKRGVSLLQSGATSDILAIQPLEGYDSTGERLWADEISFFWYDETGKTIRHRLFNKVALSNLGLDIQQNNPLSLSEDNLKKLRDSGGGSLVADRVLSFGISTGWKTGSGDAVASAVAGSGKKDRLDGPEKTESIEMVLEVSEGV